MSKTTTATAECVITWDDDEQRFVLDFAKLPLDKMVNVARFNGQIGWIGNWELVLHCARRGLEKHLSPYVSSVTFAPIPQFVLFVRPSDVPSGHRTLQKLTELLEEAQIVTSTSVNQLPPSPYA